VRAKGEGEGEEGRTAYNDEVECVCFGHFGCWEQGGMRRGELEERDGKVYILQTRRLLILQVF
jgi:hypothetical protein